MIPLRRLAWALVLAGAAVAGCGDRPPLPDACRAGDPRAVVAALRAAPGAVRLPGGVPLSACVERARSDSDLQIVGAALTAAGDRLGRTAARDRRAALELGYLDGAVTRGAGRTNGVASELVNRIDHLAGDGASAAARKAFARGRAAGLRDG